MSKYKYITKSKNDLIVLVLDGERINLVGGSAELTLPATKRRPAQKALVRGVTDVDVEKILSDPVKYGDWSDKFIDKASGFPPKFTIQATVKKSPDVADEKAKDEDPVTDVKEPERKPKKEKTSKAKSSSKKKEDDK